MRTSINTTKVLRVPVLFLWAIAALPLFSSLAFGEEAVCVYVSHEGNAWIIRKDSSVKATLNVGDPVYEGDSLYVTHGNTAQLAFDKDMQNVVQMEGDTNLKISTSNPARLDLASGKIYALLNNHETASQFKVYTPTAIAAVRGTRYQVNFINTRTEVATYQGAVRVTGLDANGKETDSVTVAAGQKTAVEEIGKAPLMPQAMSYDEMRQIDPVVDSVAASKTSMPEKSIGLAAQSDKSDQKADESEGAGSNSAKPEKNKKPAEKGLVVL